jgi:hypothetical protein
MGGLHRNYSEKYSDDLPSLFLKVMYVLYEADIYI